MDKLIEIIERDMRMSDFIIRKKGRTILKDYDISPAQFRTLQVIINHNDEMNLSELSEKMDMACSTVTETLKRMEKLELVKREKDEKDARFIKISALPKGHDIINSVIKIRREYLQEVLGALTREEHESLAKNLEKLVSELQKTKSEFM